MNFVLVLISFVYSIAAGAAPLAVWVNSGEDKVTSDEMRMTKDGAVTNAIWDGKKVKITGAKNEVLQFNVILEAGESQENLQFRFKSLKGSKGEISSHSSTRNDIFTWVNRPIEIFYIRYLQIKGLSRLSYDTYDERHVPKRFQRSHILGKSRGKWSDRADHDKFYPEIAVPYELIDEKGGFSIEKNQNQSIWVDVYVSKNMAAGIYEGAVEILSKGKLLQKIPVELDVKNITLPEVPVAKTMLNVGYSSLAKRYTGVVYPNAGTIEARTTDKVLDRHFLVAHRHKLSLFDANVGASVFHEDRPRNEWIPRLNGSLFSKANGYDGPGVGTGNGVFVIGSYGSWSWKNEGEKAMHTHTDAWVNWFQKNAADTEYFLYLIDESTNTKEIEKWTIWMKSNPGVGRKLKSFATIPLPLAEKETSLLDIAGSWFVAGDTDQWENAVKSWKSNSSKMFFLYNGKRPASGSFATEDDGVALRVLSWTQYKKKIDRWFFWESTYYDNYQGGRGDTNVFQTAQTFGSLTGKDAVLGETGWNYSNGDGVLFYPGTDKVFSKESYNLMGPMVSLRMKHWRRGIQDVDYIALAMKKNPAATEKIINRMIPKVLWDYGVSKKSDPTWVRSDISWSTNPDDWENAKRELIAIIMHGE